MENINNLVEGLLQDKEKGKEIYEKIKNSIDYLAENFEGTINSDNLLKLIDKSYKDKCIKKILGSILYFCDFKSVTNQIFQKLIRYPGRIRRSYLIALGHCNLSFYQLMYLNEKNVGTEAFCQLIYIMYSNDCFTDKDLKYFIDNNSYPSILLDSEFNYLLSLNIKVDVTKELLIKELQQKL